jgi:hypothetical protein
MNAYKIDKYIICADVPDEAKNFFLYEVGEPLSADVEMMEWDCVVPCENGENKTIRDIINRVLDERNDWLRMGIPCDLHCPFVIAQLP